MSNTKMLRCSVYPHFEVFHNGKKDVVSARCAGRLLSEGRILGADAYESDGTKRPITDEERKELKTAAEEWAATP